MGTYHIKMEVSELEMTPITENEQKQRKTKPVSVRLSNGSPFYILIRINTESSLF